MPSLFASAVSSMRSGEHLARRRDVVQIDDVADLRIAAQTAFPYQVDGDDAGDVEALAFAFVDDALAVAIPPRPRG